MSDLSAPNFHHTVASVTHMQTTRPFLAQMRFIIISDPVLNQDSQLLPGRQDYQENSTTYTKQYSYFQMSSVLDH